MEKVLLLLIVPFKLILVNASPLLIARLADYEFDNGIKLLENLIIEH